MKALLSAKAEDIRARLLRTVAAEAMERNQATKARFDAIIEKLQEEPQVRPAARSTASPLRNLVLEGPAATLRRGGTLMHETGAECGAAA